MYEAFLTQVSFEKFTMNHHFLFYKHIKTLTQLNSGYKIISKQKFISEGGIHNDSTYTNSSN